MADKAFTVIEHLEELGRRVIISLVALAICTLACVPFAPLLLEFLKAPAAGSIDKLAYFSPEEAFLLYMRIGLLAGLMVSFPVLAYQLWLFASPAMEERFKKYTLGFVVAASAAFMGGCAFAYLALLPTALKFLLGIGNGQLTPVISASRYISFVVGLIIACGVVFEMPVASFFLARTGIINAGLMRRKFKYAIVAIAIAAAVITPTGDVFNMMALALPMVALYEISIWVVFAAGKKGGYR